MKQKIIYIANVRLPTEKAHGLQIMKMCEAFGKFEVRSSKFEEKDSRIEVELVVPRRRNPITEDPFDYYGVERNFTVTRIPTLDIVSFGRVGFWVEQTLFLLFARLYLFGKKCFVYTREEATGFFFRNNFLELHTLPAHEGAVHRLLWRRARHIFVLTTLMKEQLMEWGISEQKLTVLPDAVDFNAFDISISKEDARKKLFLPLDKKIVLYTGSFFRYPWKGVDTLLEVAQNYQKEEVLFVLVGGSERELKQAKEKYPGKNIVLLGHESPRAIPLFLKASDVLVLPNKSGYEMSEKHTSPLKLFEYMASGRPIVSSDIPSLREVLTEKEAIFFKPNDPKDLARVLAELLNNSVLADSLSESAREKAKSYTWDKRAERALGVLVPNVSP
ncbi:MAG: glycosyltransferase [bacterium]|nr:glycosyltransferase [bacterium]